MNISCSTFPLQINTSYMGEGCPLWLHFITAWLDTSKNWGTDKRFGQRCCESLQLSVPEREM